jgi:hypothetical protein
MQNSIIQVNPRGSLQVRYVGQEKTPVITIDNFVVDTSEIIDCACLPAAYGPDRHSSYPGVRAPLPRDYVLAVLNSIHRLLFQVYRVPAELGLKPANTVYSLVSTAPEDLSLAQRVPHFDSTGPWHLAILHYLNPGDFCATGLFRHRPTGFERISQERLARFIESSEEHVRAHGQPPRQYISDSTDHFELYDRVGYQANRLVVYPGNLLHSGLVDPAKDINPDPRTGRLTANIFVDFIADSRGEVS